MRNLLISSLLLFCCVLFGSRQSFFHPQSTSRTSATLAATACVIPDTTKYEAEYGVWVGSGAKKEFRSNASNDTNVSTHSAVKFKMLYAANAIKICYGTGNTGSLDLKVNGVSKGTFTITSTGGYNNIGEAQVTVNVNAGDTVYVGSPGVYIELDCIKAYKAPNKKPYVSISVPTVNDTIPINEVTSFAATANDTDGTVAAVKFKIAGDTTVIDSTAPYGFNYRPDILGQWNVVATVFDDCGDSTVSATRVFFVEDDSINVERYEAEQATFVGSGLAKVYRNGVSNDTNVQYISYTDKGVQVIMNHDADGIIIGYGTFQNGTFRLKVNGVNKGLFNIIHSNGYTNVYQAALNVPVLAGDTVFVGSPGAGGAYLELDYIDAFTRQNVSPYVSITEPGEFDTLYLDSTYTFSATAGDTDGTIDSVMFWVDGYEPFVDATAPYSYTFTADSIGVKNLTATAYDNEGASTITSVRHFFVRTIIPDSLKYEAEHGILIGTAAVRTGVTGASNNSTVMNATGTGYIKFKMTYAADAIVLGYGTGVSTPGAVVLKKNGTTVSSFVTGYTGGYGVTKEAVITTAVAAGDSIFIGPGSGGYCDIDYIKAYNANGYRKGAIPGDTAFVPENEDWDYFVTKVKSGQTIRMDTLDGKKFKIKNDSLVVTQASFDYERKDRYYFMLDTGSADMMFLVEVTNVTGVFDANGPATAAVAAKYPGVNEGDYIYWNATGQQIFDNSGINVAYPNKVLIHAKEYSRISINMVNAHGNSNNQKIVVTNFLGQVETQTGFNLKNIDAVRLTGRYDSANGYGHRYFKGWDDGYEFRQGTFGIYANNRWLNEGDHLVSFDTTTNRVEVDYIECANGGFTGLSWKDDGAPYSTITDSSSIHHCYIHDIGSEGLYIGSTQTGQQQAFKNLVIENNVILRTGGEGIQMGWQMNGGTVRNNIVHAGFDWKYPFQPYQDGVMQLSAIGGGQVLENNIWMGGGEVMGIVEIKRNLTPYTINEDTIMFKNNLIYGVRAGMLTHFVKYDTVTNTDSITHIVFDGNHYKQIGEDYYEVNLVSGTLDTAQSSIFDLRTSYNERKVRNCFYDHSVNYLFRPGYLVADSLNNTKKEIPYPQFRNYLGKADSFNYLNMSRYTDYTKHYQPTETNASQWKVGNIVQWWNTKGETRFYECIQATSNPDNKPPQNNTSTAYWQLLYWIKANGDTSYFPPDDVRLDAGSYFDSLGVGIDTVAPAPSIAHPAMRGMQDNFKGNNGTYKNTQVDEETNVAVIPTFKVFPNPASKELTIESSLPIQSVNVYDALGKEWTNKQANGAVTTLVDVSRLQNGVYFVRISTSTGHTHVNRIEVIK